MPIINSLPNEIGLATEYTNGLMSAEDKIKVNKINRMEADIGNKMNKDDKIKSSQLDTSSDAVKIQMNNLSEEIKSKLGGTGGEGSGSGQVEIGNGSLITDYYADGSVTFAKRTPVGSEAVIASTEYCNFVIAEDSDDVVLSIPANYAVYFGDNVITITDIPETLTMVKGQRSAIVYNKIEGFLAYSDMPVREQDFLLGVFDGENVSMFNGRYTVNGSVVIGDNILDGNTIKDFSIDSKKLAVQHGTIISNVINGPYINVNFASKFIESLTPFDINIADQCTLTIQNRQESTIPDNVNNSPYLYIYYDLSVNKLKTLWCSSNIENSILANNAKLVLLGIVYNQEIAVGLNNEFISVNATSIKPVVVHYTDIFSGQVIMDFANKKILATKLTALVDNKVLNLTEADTQTIIISDAIYTDIITNKIPYTLAAVKVDFDHDAYRLVFRKTEDIFKMGLNVIPLTTIKEYVLSGNKDNIVIIDSDNTVIKTENLISSGEILPFDTTTLIAELTSQMVDGNLSLSVLTRTGTSVIDENSNFVHDITVEQSFDTVVLNAGEVQSVLYNTKTNTIEIVSTAKLYDNNMYISLGFLYGIGDDNEYTATGPILEHITLNGKRPANYGSFTGPDPDKGYDWYQNRLVIPSDIYLLPTTTYTLHCQNMSTAKFVDNDYINYEIALPTGSAITENTFNVQSLIEGTFATRIVGKFKGNNNCLFKDVNFHFVMPDAKPITVLCIGDDTVDMNMPGYISRYLKSIGYTPTMLGTVKNAINVNGYGLIDLEDEYGEGHKGWRFTDIMCKTKHRDGTPYYVTGNPFNNNNAFDFANYMTTNSYDKVDAVVISAGLNDITGYHIAAATEDIEELPIEQITEQLPAMYKEMIANIHAYNADIKIIINPTMIKGIDDDFNEKSLRLTEVLLHELKDLPNVTFAPGYLSQPVFAGANQQSTANYPVSCEMNDTKLGPSVSSSEINGMGQSILAFLITSNIIAVTR